MCKVQIASGLDFSLAVESGSGRLFSFGDNSLGQLGRPAATANRRCAEDWLVRDVEGVPLLVDTVTLLVCAMLGEQRHQLCFVEVASHSSSRQRE